MTLIGLEMITVLKANTYSLSGVTVSPAFSVSSPVCPMLTLDELPSNDGAYISNRPCIVRNVFTIEAYAKDMMVQSVATTKRDAAFKLIQEADILLNEKFGITMVGPIQAAPYSDPTIYRAVANYFAYIDTRTNTIYRSINKGV